MWAGKFPYQVKVKLVLPKVTEIPKKILAELGVHPAVGRCDNCVDEDLAEDLIQQTELMVQLLLTFRWWLGLLRV